MSSESTITTSPKNSSYIKRFQSSPLSTYTALLILSTCIISIIGLVLDTREFNGISTWVKPLKFQLSVSLYLLTFVWFVSYTSNQFQQGKIKRWVEIALCIGASYEVAYITIQGSLAQGSHFNISSPGLAMLYSLMALGAITFSVAAIVLGYTILKEQPTTLRPHLQQAIGWGLILSGIFGAISGFAMSENQGHLIDAPDNDAHGVWIFGWSREYGDLRISHFLALHALHIIPLFALSVSFLTQKVAKYITTLFILLFTLVTIYTYIAAQMGIAWVNYFSF